MLIYTFDYTKENNKTSRRVLVPFAVPHKHYAGVDVSELSVEDQALYITEVERAKTEYADRLAQLEQKYDLRHRYRQFVPERMSNVKSEDI